MRLNSCSFVALMRGSIGGGLCLGATLVAAPIGSWTFDETGGPTASDSSGNSLNASLSGSPSWTSGHQQGALQLDGTSTYGTIPDSPLLDGTDQLTISFWVKPTGLDGNPQFILSKRTSPKQNQSYALFFGTGNKLNVDINLNEGTGDRFESTTVFENDQWYQVTLVYDGTAHPSQRARLYVNGSLDRDAALSTTFIPDRASSLFLGTGQANHPYKFKGLLDELSIFRNIPAEESLASAHQGLWTIENWQPMAYKEIGDLVKDPKFYRTPSSKKVLRSAGRNLDWYQSGGRLRGRITVPVSGRYVFWLSAKTAADLLISPDGLPYAKKRIAHLSPLSGTGEGIGYNDPNPWDQFVSQMSEPIQLDAGQSYYIETLCQVNLGGQSQVRLAWAPENGIRTEIPASAFSYYLIPGNDKDDDSLPDDWEQAVGLDLSDNGSVDIARQGERGDDDGDGLTNREEYLLGTDPKNKDTDSDGRTDYDEVKAFKSNPLVSDLPAETVVSVVPIEDIAASANEWVFADGGMISDSFRGDVAWDFTVDEAGVWLLQLGSRLRGKVYAPETVEVNVFIDGRQLGRYSIEYGGSHRGLLRVVTPLLTSGTHRLKLEIDNLLGRRSVQMDSLDVRKPTGPDSNGNQLPDWIEALLAQSDTASPHAAYSRISPFCLEGNARLANEVTVDDQPVIPGADANHWFANLPLEPAGATSYEVRFSSGLTHQSEIFWQATNVLDGGEFPVRSGDSLKLGAWSPDGFGSASISVARPHVALASGQTGVAADSLNPQVGLGSAKFEAAGAHLRLADSEELDGTDQLTVSFWAKPDAGSLDGLPRGIVSKRQATDNQVSYSIFTFTGGRLFVDIDSGANAPQRIDSGYVMTPDWQQVSVVYNGSLPAPQRLKIHVNGALVKTASVNVATLRNLQSNVVVGSLNPNYQSGGNLVSFRGLLDDVRIIRKIPASPDSTTIKLEFEDPTRLTAQTNTIQTPYEVSGTDTVVHAFGAEKSCVISAVHSNGTAGTLTVPVRQATFGTPTSVLQNTLRYWTLSSALVDPALVFEPGAGLSLGARQILDATRFRHSVYPEKGGLLGVSARLWEDGPIAGIAHFDSVALSGASQNDLATVEGSYYFGNYSELSTPTVITDLPVGGTIKVSIFRSGVTFLDGTTVRIFTVEDLVNGILDLKFLVPDNLQGGYCHYIDIYDAKGVLLGRH